MSGYSFHIEVVTFWDDSHNQLILYLGQVDLPDAVTKCEPFDQIFLLIICISSSSYSKSLNASPQVIACENLSGNIPRYS